uniref:Uncharacterized protein n=1 Tax=Rhizophora mucronata TaxID=61149 RepID=A0A2P2QNC8_RHIMU
MGHCGSPNGRVQRGFLIGPPVPRKELSHVVQVKTWATWFLKWGGYSVRLALQSSENLPLYSVEG